MTASARQEILDRIRAARAGRAEPVPIPRGYRQDAEKGVDVVALFVERAAEYRATVRRVAVGGVPAAVAEALRERGARRIAVPAGIPDAWLAVSGVEAVRDDPPLSVRALDGLDGVITGCAVAIAETGTVVLDGGAAAGRRSLSLLPDYHLCVVRADQVVASVPEAVARLAASGPTGQPQTWISGPSATSDIELDRVEGVHGPRTLHILVLEPPAPEPTTGQPTTG